MKPFSASTVAVVVGLLLVWSYFARPIYDYVGIAAGRVRDGAVEKLATPFQTQPHQAVIDAATTQVAQIEHYLLDQRAASAREPLRTLDFSSEAAYARSQESLRERLRADLRYPPPGAGTAKPELVEETSLGEDALASYARLRIRVLPGVESIGVYLEPKNAAGRLPLVIAAHGRGGAPDRPADGKLPILNHNDRDLARGALERGWAVWEPMYAFYATGQPDNLRERLTVHAIEAGTTLPAIEIAKTVAALDILSQRPEIDPARVAMVGVSYGGFYTLCTTALEPRIKAAVVAAYFNDRETVLDGSDPDGFLDWRFLDSLGLLRDPNIAALVCPRPLLIEAGNQDQLFPIEGARRAAPQAAEFYRRLGAQDRFRFDEFVGRHDFNGTDAWEFLSHFL